MPSIAIHAQGVGAAMVSEPTAFLTESGLEAESAAGRYQVAITHQAHQVHKGKVQKKEEKKTNKY